MRQKHDPEKVADFSEKIMRQKAPGKPLRIKGFRESLGTEMSGEPERVRRLSVDKPK